MKATPALPPLLAASLPRSRGKVRVSFVIAALLLSLLVPASWADRMFVTTTDYAGIYEYNSTGTEIGFVSVPGTGMATADAEGNLYAAVYTTAGGVVRVTPGAVLGNSDPKATFYAATQPAVVTINAYQNLYVTYSPSPTQIVYLETANDFLEVNHTNAQFAPMAADPFGNVYYLAEDGHSIKKISPTGGVTTAAKVDATAIACSPNGALHYVDTGTNIRSLAGPTPGSVGPLPGTIVGNPIGGYLNSMAFDSSGTLFAGNIFGEIYKYVNGTAQLFATRPPANSVFSIVFSKTPDPDLVALKNDPVRGVHAAKFTSFGYPALNANGHTAFAGKFTGMIPSIPINTSNNAGIWADDDSGARQLVVRAGAAAPGTGAAVFKAFADPVYDGNNAVSFRATLVGGIGGVVTAGTANNSTGIWSNRGGTLHLVARAAAQAPGCPTGATFKSFAQLVLPDQGGVVFLASLNPSAPAGVNGTNNLGIWAVDPNGNVQLIVRKGDTIPVNGGSRKITTLAFLPAAAPVAGQTRNFAQATGNLTYRASFSDGNTAILKVVFPE